MKQQKQRYWLTPAPLMAALDAEFHFDFDPCPNPVPSGFDGLAVQWGSSNWVNPPFMGGYMKWARKAISELELGRSSVVIVPCYQPRVIQLLAEHSTEVRYAGTPAWLSIETGEEIPFAPKDRCPCFLFILRPPQR